MSHLSFLNLTSSLQNRSSCHGGLVGQLHYAQENPLCSGLETTSSPCPLG